MSMICQWALFWQIAYCGFARRGAENSRDPKKGDVTQVLLLLQGRIAFSRVYHQQQQQQHWKIAAGPFFIQSLKKSSLKAPIEHLSSEVLPSWEASKNSWGSIKRGTSFLFHFAPIFVEIGGGQIAQRRWRKCTGKWQGCVIFLKKFPCSRALWLKIATHLDLKNDRPRPFLRFISIKYEGLFVLRKTEFKILVFTIFHNGIILVVH